jgi:hypothetical protein
MNGDDRRRRIGTGRLRLRTAATPRQTRTEPSHTLSAQALHWQLEDAGIVVVQVVPEPSCGRMTVVLPDNAVRSRQEAGVRLLQGLTGIASVHPGPALTITVHVAERVIATA